MKKIVLCACVGFMLFSVYAAEADSQQDAVSVTEETEDEGPKYVPYPEKLVPEPRRPRAVSAEDSEKSEERREQNAKNSTTSTQDYVQNAHDTFKYGLEENISELIDELTKNEDVRFVDDIYDLFHVTKSVSVRQKILSYFAKIEDPCLSDFACEIINDPYDTKKSVVSECMSYISAVKCKEAIPGLIDLIDREDEDYFTLALSTLGDVGGTNEALFLAEYLDRDDLSVAQRQSLMRVLGKIKAVQTWKKLSQIAQDEDENSFVRMYAAEAIGAMELEESKPILMELFESDDANFRIYVIKGLSHYHDEQTYDVILQALRDSQYKVRLEAVAAVKSLELTDAVPFLIYRCKDTKEEAAVKNKCYDAIAFLNTKEGNEYLISLITDKKPSDTTKATVASALLEYNHAGTEAIIALAKETLGSDLQKNLRYALGKEFAKYGRPEFAEICAEYLKSTDVSTQGTGLDIWAKGRYASVRQAVVEISKQDGEVPEEEEASGNKKPKKNANAEKAKRILQMVDSL